MKEYLSLLKNKVKRRNAVAEKKPHDIKHTQRGQRMAQRNTEKRNQILRVAYDAVSISYIAEKTGIKKSLL